MADRSKLDRHIRQAEAPHLIATAAKVAGYDLGKQPEFASAANVSGVRNRKFTFSRRRDSHTMFGSDVDYGPLGKAGAWTGPDRQVAAVCRRALRAAAIPAREIAGIDVLSEMGAVGEQVDGKIRSEEPELLRKVAHARRAVDEIPVWSSYAKVGLTDAGEVGYLELHWPELPPAVVEEARLLHDILERGFESPEVPDASPQAMEAGVMHSPAVGFFMDVVAAVRVVYVPKDPRMGRLVSLYVDRHAELVALPRHLRVSDPEERERETPVG